MPSSMRDGCCSAHGSRNMAGLSSSRNAGRPRAKLCCMCAPTTRVVKHVASSSNTCNQYCCRGWRAAYTGIGRRYSTVEEAMGGVDSDMRLWAHDSSEGLPLDATTRKEYLVPST